MMGKDDTMQLGNMDGFFRALSIHEVTSHSRPEENDTFLSSGSIQLHNVGGFCQSSFCRSKEGRFMTPPTPQLAICSVTFLVEWWCDNKHRICY